MNSDLSGKKLLIIGANSETVPLVETANQMGVLTYVTSNRPNDVAKKYAYKACDVNGMDVDELVNLINNEHIDGVIVGVADFLVPFYYEVCKRKNFPCYASLEAIRCLGNKIEFKKKLQDVGLPVIPEYQETPDFINNEYDKLPYPIVIKPVDAGGSNGVSMVYSKNDFKDALIKAKNASHSHRIQIEKLMTGDVVSCYYTIIDGSVFLSSFEENLFSHVQKGICPVTIGHIYASKYYNLYIQTAHNKICQLLSDVKAKNGVLQINAFVQNDRFYFYDPGYRLQGEAQYHILNSVNKFNHPAMLVNFALSSKMCNFNFINLNDPLLHGQFAVSIWILLRAGIIGKISGINEIIKDKRVAFNGQRLNIGDEITNEMLGTEKQVFTRLYLICDSYEKLIDIIKFINDNVKIIDVNGLSMIVDMLQVYNTINKFYRQIN